MDSELLKQLAELNDKYLEIKAENEALKSMLKDTCDWYVKLKEENERLKELMQLKDLYIGILSHDLEDCASIAFAHGYESRWVKQGFEVRKKIDALEITNQ